MKADSTSSNPTGELMSVLPIPVLQKQWPSSAQLNSELREVILKKREANPSLHLSNVGGWLSAKDLQSWDCACVRQLLALIELMWRQWAAEVLSQEEPAASDWQIESWANVNQRGHGNRLHQHLVHPQTMLSGIYYVDGGGDGNSGATVFHRAEEADPCLGAATFGNEFKVTPEPGLMLLFPATLLHRVEPYHGGEERITISWNLRDTRMEAAKTRQPFKREEWMWRNYRGLMLARGATRTFFSRRNRKSSSTSISNWRNFGAVLSNKE